MSNVSTAPFVLTVRLAEPFRNDGPAMIEIDTPVRTLGELTTLLESRIANFAAANNELFNFALNGELILHGEKDVALHSGDEVELLVAFAGG